MPFIETIEKCLGKPALKNFLVMQQGHVVATFADPGLIEALTGFVSVTHVATGVEAFVDWYREYYDDA